MNSNNSNSMDNSDLLKMVFVYNAIQNGWTVKKLKDGSFEFTKENQQERKFAEEFMSSFFKNMCLLEKTF